MATLLLLRSAVRPPLPEAGAIIAGRYEITRPIGQGGSGAVFAARHLGTGQDVALKILLPPHDADETLAIKRFFLEARVTSGLRHPNTVRVFDFGQDDSGLVYLALELLSGTTLKKAIRERLAEERAFSEAEAIDIAAAITKSLSEAHGAGLVHRDLKPENVFLHEVSADERVVKVFDFGIAKLGGGHPTLSTPDTAPGTPAYMSPEQALSGEVDARSDLYALGVILYQLVAGRLPFFGSSDPETLYMHAYRAPPDLKEHAKSAITPAFEAAVYKALAKDPAQRFQSAAEMREVLLAIPAAGAADAMAGSRSRLPWIAAAIAVVGLGIGFGAFVYLSQPAVSAPAPQPAVAAPAAEPEPQVVHPPEPEVVREPEPEREAEPERPQPAQPTKAAKPRSKRGKTKSVLHKRIEDFAPERTP